MRHKSESSLCILVFDNQRYFRQYIYTQEALTQFLSKSGFVRCSGYLKKKHACTFYTFFFNQRIISISFTPLQMHRKMIKISKWVKIGGVATEKYNIFHMSKPVLLVTVWSQQSRDTLCFSRIIPQTMKSNT